MTKVNLLNHSEGTTIIRAMCSCMGIALTTLQMHKLMGNHHIAIPHKSKSVKRKSHALDMACEYNLVARTEASHLAGGTLYTYTITGLGFTVLQQIFNCKFYLLAPNREYCTPIE